MKIQKILDEIRNTGERPILNKEIEDIDPVLQAAYMFATKHIGNNDTVLDYGCGGGYGAEYLSRFTKNLVIGYDVDRGSIKSAQEYFKNSKNLKFTEHLDNDEKFDVIVSFQVIEHLGDRERHAYMRRIQALLKDSGVFFLSTVNKNISSYKLRKPVMPFHIKEFYPEELNAFLEKHFGLVRCCGQIDREVLRRVREREFDYREVKRSGLRGRVLSTASQCELVRKIARNTPLALKSIIFNYQKDNNVYEITEVPEEIDNSYILIYKCHK